MPTITLTPDGLNRELGDFAEKLRGGAKHLRSVGDPRPGACARDRVHAIDNVGLYHYQPRASVDRSTPIIITYALVNRAEMTDLQPDRSLIRGLLEQGLDIYLIDWDYPTGAEKSRDLDAYLNKYIDGCVDWIRERYELDAVNLLGVCQGGTFSTCYAALHPDKVRNLITTVTPIDFHTKDDMLSHIFRHVDVDALVDADGNVSGDLLNLIFLSLKPFRLAQQKYVDLVSSLDDPAALEMFSRMEHWIFDSPSLAGQAFREFAKQFYQNNSLIRGEVIIGDKTVSLANVGMPVLNIYASSDHLVPTEASKALGKYVGTQDYTELEFPGGHIGLYVSSRAHKLVPGAIAEWLAQR